ncbi:MAG: hypothetical protein OEW69_12020 [Nitrospirota bacterium]|nr:hypothetical protein [Nitrospirota bacterium]MDH5630223.1 hypothetical protein [Gammaproteobacteria bacterium]
MKETSLVKYYFLLFSLGLLTGCNDSNFTQKHSTADEVMNDFYEAKNRAEDMLMDPLIVNSDIVKQRVIEEIKDKNMDKRRYAIGYLGNEKINEALPMLTSILEDENEIDYFRSDALESIYSIDKQSGLTMAKKYSDREDLLGRRAKSIFENTYRPFIRSYEDAKNGVHY